MKIINSDQAQANQEALLPPTNQRTKFESQRLTSFSDINGLLHISSSPFFNPKHIFFKPKNKTLVTQCLDVGLCNMTKKQKTKKTNLHHLNYIAVVLTDVGIAI